MSTSQFSRIDRSQLYGPFADKVEACLDACAARGALFVITSGLRTVDEQDALYARGRTVPPLGHFVTKARGGFSAHNYGCGVDACRDGDLSKDGLQPTYDADQYSILGEEAPKVGLEWGGSWTSIKDLPHLQLPLKTFSLGWNVLLDLYRHGGLTNVWARLDQVHW